jgi:Xaa-Pro aminopeptidase
MNHALRITRLRRQLTQAGFPAILVTHLPDVRWLSGFTGSSAALIVTRKAVRLYTDSRYRDQAAQEASSATVEIVSGPPALAALRWFAAQSGPGPLAYEPTHVTLAEFQAWRAALPASQRRSLLKPIAPPVLEPLRQIKDDDEIVLMRQAAALGCTIFDHMLGFLRPGLTELAVAAELEYQARRRGAEAMSFETIVASGPRSALPHGRATERKLPRNGFLTLDFGVVLNGYCSDMTRTVYLGRPTSRHRQTYEAVLAAQQAAISTVRHGISAGQVDEAARSVLRDAGLAQAFTHSTGHGVGLEIHEGPRIGAAVKTPLRTGMVVTIEPGVYFPADFGIRIEDMVVVRPSGSDLLTTSPTALIQL